MVSEILSRSKYLLPRNQKAKDKFTQKQIDRMLNGRIVSQ